MPDTTISTTRRGVIQRWTATIIPTTREAPTDAEVPSHVLLHRAGFIRPVGAGIYDYLPLAWRSLTKIAAIVREEMDAAGASEMLMPALEPFELFKDTKRDETYGDNLFRLKDRKGRTNALAPTHEEVITDLMKGVLTSYKQLPLNLYQVQTKFRDEARPRAGLLRCREFIMKDAYSFHLTLDGPGGLGDTYDRMFTAYSNIFRRCGLSFKAVEAESGPIGGSASHEFMVTCESGEDTVLTCAASGYAANVEKCEIGARPRGTFQEPPTGDLAEVHTPNLPGIDEVGKFMKVKPDRMLKTIVFRAAGGGGGGGGGGGVPAWVVAVVRGDHDVNEGKVKALAGVDAVALASLEEAKKAGFAVGYVSPRVVNTVPGVRLLIDADASLGGFWASGADKADHHVKHFNWRREVGAALDDPARVIVGDVRNAAAGDPSPRAEGSALATTRGIEVGHIFKLGTKYSDAMGLKVLDDQQKSASVIMGCYGIGVSRTLAAAVEQNHDANGILFPAAIAPYHAVITVMKPDDSRQADAAGRLADALARAGVDVLIDDRDERPGVKFKDADLIGVPVRLTVGDKALDQDAVEFKLRKDTAGKGENVPMSGIVERCVGALNG
ncbi:MAG: proline--tRNA ligase [Phycisphaeraceae bacterium]|nr:MAG: proline--tRNA ligase [Phycisphaeraceae bacterium]